MYKKGQKFSVVSDDQQTFEYTIMDVLPCKVVVYLSHSDVSLGMSPEALTDLLRVVGAKKISTRYKVWLINHLYYLHTEFEYLNQAIEYGKGRGFEFRIDLGDMPCASWSPLGGLRYFTEYQRWAQDQVEILQQVSGH